MPNRAGGGVLMLLGAALGVYALVANPAQMLGAFYTVGVLDVMVDYGAMGLAIMTMSAKVILAIYAGALFVAGAIFATQRPA